MNPVIRHPRAIDHLLFLALLCTSSSAAQSALTPLKIATLSPLSGPLAQTGEQLKQGAQLALEAHRAQFARLGFALELSPQDDQASAEVGVAVARRLLADPSVLGVVGAVNSGVVLAASSVLAEDTLALVIPAATNNAITARGLSNVFRIGARDEQQGRVAGRYILERLRAKKVYLISDKTAYGAGLVAEVEKVLGPSRILASEGTEERSDFSSLILKIRALNPDLIYFGGTYPQVGPFLKQLRSSGIQTRVMGGHGLDSSGLAAIAGESARGVVFTTVAAPAAGQVQAKRFLESYRKTFGRDADGYGVLAFEAMNTTLEAVRRAVTGRGERPSRAAVSKALSSLRFSSLSGTVQFDGRGDRLNPRVYVLELGTTLEPIRKAVFKP